MEIPDTFGALSSSEPSTRDAVGVLFEWPGRGPVNALSSLEFAQVTCTDNPGVEECFPSTPIDSLSDHEGAAARAVQFKTGLCAGVDFVPVRGIMPVVYYSQSFNGQQAEHLVPFIRVTGADFLPPNNTRVVMKKQSLLAGLNDIEHTGRERIEDLLLSDREALSAIHLAHSEAKRKLQNGWTEASASRATHGAAVVFKDNPENPQDPLIRLIFQSKNKQWGYPKGHVERNRDRGTLDTARREAWEEGGIVGRMSVLPHSGLQVGWKSGFSAEDKTAEVWAFQYHEDDDPVPRDPAASAAKWVPFSERMTYLDSCAPAVHAIDRVARAAKLVLRFSRLDLAPIDAFGSTSGVHSAS